MKKRITAFLVTVALLAGIFAFAGTAMAALTTSANLADVWIYDQITVTKDAADPAVTTWTSTDPSTISIITSNSDSCTFRVIGIATANDGVRTDTGLSCVLSQKAKYATVTFEFRDSSTGATINSTVSSVNPITLGRAAKTFSSSDFIVSGYSFRRADPATYTPVAGENKTVTVYMTRSNSYPWYPGLGDPFDYYKYGTWYNGSWYPDYSYYYNNSNYMNYFLASQMPDVTINWNNSTYTIPGWTVYEWVTNGKAVPWSSSLPAPTLSSSSSTTSTTSTSTAKSNVYVGGQLQLTSSMLGGVDPANRSIFFRSSNTGVATITDNGLVTGVGAGTTRITAFDSYGRSYGAWDLTVGSRAAVTSIVLNKTKLTMKRNSEYRLIASSRGEVVDVDWTSSNTDIATVSGGWVTTGSAKGKVVIIASSPDGKISRSCTITVK